MRASQAVVIDLPQEIKLLSSVLLLLRLASACVTDLGSRVRVVGSAITSQDHKTWKVMSYTRPQIELLRTKLRAYFWAEKALAGDDFSWLNLNERFALHAGLRVPGDTLRQFAERQLSRGKPRPVGDEILDAIVRFLTHPEINYIRIDELKEPEIPFHFVLQLMEALKHHEGKRPIVPPPGLEGTYRAIAYANGKISDIRLTILISSDGNLVHLTEEANIYRDTPFKNFAQWSAQERKLYFDKFSESRGWAVLTPEDNLLGFLKRKVLAQYRDNHFYATMGVIPDFSDKTVKMNNRDIEHMALLAYDVHYGPEDENPDKQAWFQEKCRKTISKIRHFMRVTEES